MHDWHGIDDSPRSTYKFPLCSLKWGHYINILSTNFNIKGVIVFGGAEIRLRWGQETEQKEKAMDIRWQRKAIFFSPKKKGCAYLNVNGMEPEGRQVNAQDRESLYKGIWPWKGKRTPFPIWVLNQVGPWIWRQESILPEGRCSDRSSNGVEKRKAEIKGVAKYGRIAEEYWKHG